MRATGTEVLSDDTLYAVLGAHDPRFDGRFFVGVSSTGIYCRAVCTAKMPKRENCTFFTSAAAAEAQGYRPCLKCRPELAPGIPVSYEMTDIAHNAAAIIRNGDFGEGLTNIAERLGVSERQMRRVFKEEFGVSPQAYRNTCRLLLAKSLLTDTDMPITKVAYACGFSSVRRFNDAFSNQYRMPPSRLRNDHAVAKKDSPSVKVHIGYRPPYRFDLILAFLEARAIEGVEAVVGGAYYRTVCLDTLKRNAVKRKASSEKSATESAIGWIKVENVPEKNRLKLTVSSELFDELPTVIAQVRRLFDTDCIPQAVEEGLKDFHALTPDVYHVPGIRVPCGFDGFEMAVRAILGQQITVKAAGTLAGRIARSFGGSADVPVEGLDTAFPAPEAFCDDDAEERLGVQGVVRQRAKAIVALARAVSEGFIDLSPFADIREMSDRLIDIPGIGAWTVQYLLMRVYGYPDAFLVSDLGVKKAFPDMKEQELKEHSAAWSPWRSYVMMSLWCAPHE